ncbi:MAG: zf-HC2 domain-containing protein [Candidatus Poribacteria bacterium]
MTCDEIKEKFIEFLDNELSETDRKIVQSHLDNCADCADELNSIQKFLANFRKLKTIKPSRNWDSELDKKLTKAQRPPEVEFEILRSAIIGLNQRIQKLEEMRGYVSPFLEGEIMNVEELARYLRMSVDKIYEIIDQIPNFRIGYEYRFVKASIDQWIRSLEQNSYQDQEGENYENSDRGFRMLNP